MNNVQYIVYINEQSTKPLVHTIAEAKQYATRHKEYKPSLRIECYCMPYLISKWIYDYQGDEWVEQVICSNSKLYQLMK